MDEDNISRGLAVLAEDMPTPDIGDIVTTARARIRRRRSIHATWIGTAAVVGLLAGTVVLADGRPSVSAAAPPTATPTSGPVSVPNNTPIIDDRARSLDDQLNNAKAEVIPNGMIISPAPVDQVRVDGRVLGFEFYTTASAEDGKSQSGPSTFAGRGYGLKVQLSDNQGSGTLQITVMHAVGAQPHLIPSCAALGGNCVPANLPDGTRAIVTSGESARGYPNPGTDIHLYALRPDGTYITILCTNLPIEAGPNSIGVVTRLQPPLSQADLLKFATVFNY